MNVQTVAIAAIIVFLGTAHYVLCFQALRDVRRRARVRGNNRVLWALAILSLPIAGPLIYNWMGPTSFRSRPLIAQPESSPATPSNVTPIFAARSTRTVAPPTSLRTRRPATRRATPTNRRSTRTGS